MGNLFITPTWFFGYDIILEVLFAIITLLVCGYAWKIYKITNENQLRLFSWAFLFIGLSYIAQSILNFLILMKLDDYVCGVINLQSVYHLNLFGIYLHAILFLIGLLIMAYISLKIDNAKAFMLLLIIIFASLYFSPYKTFTLYLLSSILLIFTSYHYLIAYMNNRKTTTLMVLMAMILLFIGNISFILATNKASYYVIGHMLEFLAYILVLVNLLIVLRIGKQKRKNGKKTR
ncbi:MAG: hypothetical protein ACP5N1_00695 [Candidatus Woesearchaeota archaeon]